MVTTLKGVTMSPLPPKEVIDGRWEIIKLVGLGGVSDIYKAGDRVVRTDSHRVALKMVKEELQTDDTIREGFRNEISVLTGLPYLRHPNAPQFEGAGEW
ncbi:MAG: hypothetical protein ACRER2_09250 [Methylococcales bacterium]